MQFCSVFNPNPVFTSVTVTSLTSGRVPYVTTGGLLTDSASLTFDGTTLTSNSLLLTCSTGNNYAFKTGAGLDANQIGIEGQGTNQNFSIQMCTHDGNGNDNVFLHWNGVGTLASLTNSELLQIGYAGNATPSSRYCTVRTVKNGSGTVQPLKIYTGSNTAQLVLNTNGTINTSNTVTIGGALIVAGQSTLSDEVSIGASTTILTIESDGDTFWTGDDTGLPYGSFYGNEIAFSSGALTAPQYVIVADTDCSQGELNEIAYTDAGTTLTISKAGRYLVNWSLSAESGAANTHILAGIMINSSTTLQNAGRNHIEAGTANRQYATSGTAIFDLAESDAIGVGVGSDVDNITIAVDHINLTICMIGGT